MVYFLKLLFIEFLHLFIIIKEYWDKMLQVSVNCLHILFLNNISQFSTTFENNKYLANDSFFLSVFLSWYWYITFSFVISVNLILLILSLALICAIFIKCINFFIHFYQSLSESHLRIITESLTCCLIDFIILNNFIVINNTRIIDWA